MIKFLTAVFKQYFISENYLDKCAISLFLLKFEKRVYEHIYIHFLFLILTEIYHNMATNSGRHTLGAHLMSILNSGNFSNSIGNYF